MQLVVFAHAVVLRTRAAALPRRMTESISRLMAFSSTSLDLSPIGLSVGHLGLPPAEEQFHVVSNASLNQGFAV